MEIRRRIELVRYGLVGLLAAFNQRLVRELEPGLDGTVLIALGVVRGEDLDVDFSVVILWVRWVSKGEHDDAI